MNIQGWVEITLTLSAACLLGWPLGVYMSRVWNGERTWLDPVLKPVEGLFYRAPGSIRRAVRGGSATPGRCWPSISRVSFCCTASCAC